MARRVLFCMFGLLLSLTAHSLSGTLCETGGAPVPNAFLALLDASWSSLAHATTGSDGAFQLDTPGAPAYLVVQPPTRENADGLQVCAFEPRIYQVAGDSPTLELRLPPAAGLVLEAYDTDGRLMRWADFERNGTHAGQFLYTTNLREEAIPAACWPVHGALTGGTSGPRAQGLPALYVAPGVAAAFNVLFWPVRGYGKLMLRADNAGRGYLLAEAGESRLLLLNLELARTAVTDLERRAGAYAPEARAQAQGLRDRLENAGRTADRKEAAAQADGLLAEALRLRDQLELDAARAAIPGVRMGNLRVQVLDTAGAPVAGCEVSLRQNRSAFLFGVYEGSPYNAAAFKMAREAGFEYATVLPAWNWTQSPKAKKGGIDQTFGISALGKLGYRIKAHGVVWMQEYGILPDRARGMPHAELVEAALAHQRALIETFPDSFSVWEAMNEPANTNVAGLPREDMVRLLASAAANVAAAGKPALVNSPHEFSYGAEYFFHGPDNRPVDDYPMTYSAFLSLAQERGALENIDIVGLQLYPGFHLNADFGNQQGPAFTPAHLLDTIERYAGFGKSIHITELSLPSAYGAEWTAGYWREPWTESTQTDYAESVYTLAFAHPQVRSITWWDITDLKPAVLSGGLVRADGAPKASFERLRSLFAAWRTNETGTTDGAGVAAFRAFGGNYTVTVTTPEQRRIEREFDVLERWDNALTIELGEAP